MRCTHINRLPQGRWWLACDGSTVSRTDFPELFEALGTSHGSGDGAFTFHLPDYRGRFLRGVDDSATVAIVQRQDVVHADATDD